jgi:NAD(P)H-dependent flavin oxidoreductase YrpB (nitropropane dioxygenase family)
MKTLNIGGLTIQVPIIQGGMGVGISLSGLAVAVANEGGVGVISAAGLGLVHRNSAADYIQANIEGLKREIRLAKEKTKGIIGVNIMVAMSNFTDLVKTAISEKVDIIFAGRAAKLICEKWQSAFGYLPDAFVVEGPKAGGHLGFKGNQIADEHFSLEEIVPDVVREVKIFEERYSKEIPVIAAGGIYTGEDIYNILQKGARGVQLGTRFVTTEECDASPAFKKAYIDAVESDIEIIQSPVGMPGRAVKNSFLDKVKAGLKTPIKCPFHCIRTCEVTSSPYCIIMALYNAYKGRMDKGYAFAGSNAFRATRISTVKEVFADLKEGFQNALNRFGDKNTEK